MLVRKSEIEIHPNRLINMDVGEIFGIKNEYFKQMLEFNDPKNGKTQHEIQEISNQISIIYLKTKRIFIVRGAFPLSMLSTFSIQSTEIQLLFKHKQNHIEILLELFVFRPAWIIIFFVFM